MSDAPPPRYETAEAVFRRRAVFVGLLALGLVAAAAAAWALRTVLLMTFAAVILAVLLRAVAAALHRRTGLPERWAVLLIVGLLVVAAGVAVTFLVPTVIQQGGELIKRLPDAANEVQRRIGDYPWLDSLWHQISTGLSLPEPTDAMGQFGRILAGISSSLGYLGLVLGGAIFLALDPRLYRGGFLRLVPIRHRAFAKELLEELEQVIVAWLGAQLILMTFIGVMVGLGLWAIGVPYAVALGLLAGLLEFIPYLGPILAAIPAILIAIATDVTTALWTVALLVGIQQIENNVLQPIVQKSQVDTPPVLLIVAIFGMGILFGAAGVLVAAPLLAVMIVVVRRIYVERTLEGGPDPASRG